jgi:hypothetical protein
MDRKRASQCSTEGNLSYSSSCETLYIVPSASVTDRLQVGPQRLGSRDRFANSPPGTRILTRIRPHSFRMANRSPESSAAERYPKRYALPIEAARHPEDNAIPQDSLFDPIRKRLLAEGLIEPDNFREWNWAGIEGGMVWLRADGWALVLLGRSLELRVWPRGFKYAGLTLRARIRAWFVVFAQAGRCHVLFAGGSRLP